MRNFRVIKIKLWWIFYLLFGSAKCLQWLIDYLTVINTFSLQAFVDSLYPVCFNLKLLKYAKAIESFFKCFGSLLMIRDEIAPTRSSLPCDLNRILRFLPILEALRIFMLLALTNSVAANYNTLCNSGDSSIVEMRESVAMTCSRTFT